MATVKKSALVLYSAAEMYALVGDIEAYPRFLPWCRSSRVLSSNDDEVRATIEMVKGGIHKSFTTCNRMQRHKMIETTPHSSRARPCVPVAGEPRRVRRPRPHDMARAA